MKTERSTPPNRIASLRLRPDLVATERPFGHSRRWIVKDPLALRHFEFTDDEWFLLQQLDGESSLPDVQQRYAERFAPHEIQLEALQKFYAEAYQSGLTLVDGAGQASSLLDRRRQTGRRRAWNAPFSFLAVRFPFGDAQGLLDALRPLGRVLFSPRFALLLLLAMATATLLGIGRARQIAELLPSLGSFFTSSNLWLLGLAWVIVKSLHELGHGLACRRFGGECHEFGIQMIVFVPFAYCDVSDAWMMRSKWQRMIVSAAGIYVELIVATLAMYLWYFSQPGLFNSLMFNMALLCSVNTLLFNGNPLLRFDGYYLLSDWLEVPNLHAQAKEALWRPLQAWLMPAQNVQPRLDGSRLGLALFAALALSYRMLAMGIIAWTIYHFLAGVGLSPLADVLVGLMLVGLAIPALRWSWKYMVNPILRKNVRTDRSATLAGAVLVGLLAIFFCPWNRTLQAPAMLQLEDAARLYATVPGQLTSRLEAGAPVAEGEVVARLVNLDLERSVLEYQSRLEELRQSLGNLEIQVIGTPSLAAEIAATRAAIKQAEQQFRAAAEDAERLVLKAPRAGVLLPGETRWNDAPETSLAVWEGSPLEAKNANCYIESGDLLGLIGQPDRLEAILVLSEADTELLSAGTPVELRWEQAPGRRWQGKIRQVARSPVRELPPAILAEGSIPMQASAGQAPRPTGTYYFVQVELDEQPPGALPGSRGQARVVVVQSTIGRELVRMLRRTFYL